MKTLNLFGGILISGVLAVICFAQNAEPVPRFERADCAVPIPAGEKPECGYLVVREKRAAKNAKTIRLPIVILKSENDQAKNEPVLRTLGGPGASSLRLIGSRRYAPWLKNRDVVIFEQRGTKHAQPALECPEVDAANIDSLKRRLDAKKSRANEISAARRCFNRLTAQGIDLSAYNSAESAADIEDLRRALKIEKWNLWGVSYSSRLVLNVMRDYPEGVHSVVLESTLPPEVNYDEVGVDIIVAALDRLFKNCRAEADCAAAYPNLETEFYEIVAKLNREPISENVKNAQSGEISVIDLNGDDFATWLVDYLLSDSAQAIVDAPLEIRSAYEGNYTAFKRYAGAKLAPSNNSLGMRYSFWCSEELSFENRRKIARQSSVYPRLKGYEVMALPDICRVWKVPAAKAIENKAVKSDIPSLIFAGEYDAYTSPAWGRATAKNLKNSYFVEIPWTGHGPAFSTSCLNDLAAEFFNNPQKAPDSSECVEKVRRQFKFAVRKG